MLQRGTFCIYHFWDYTCLPQSCLKSAMTCVWICQRKGKKSRFVWIFFPQWDRVKKTVFACFVTPRQNSFSKSVSAEGWERTNCTPHFWFSKLQCLRFAHNRKSNCSFCDFCGKIGISLEKLLFILRYFSERSVWQKCLVGGQCELNHRDMLQKLAVVIWGNSICFMVFLTKMGHCKFSTL